MHLVALVFIVGGWLYGYQGADDSAEDGSQHASEVD